MFSIPMNSVAFDVEEILDRIFLFVDNRATLVKCMTVDRSWFHSSKKLTWRCLDSLEPLIELLSPLQEETTTSTSYIHDYTWPGKVSYPYGDLVNQTYTISKCRHPHYRIKYNDVTKTIFQSTNSIRWDRFNLYAPFVTDLNIVNHKRNYDPAVISYIALWGPRPLLPRLQALKVDACTGLVKTGYALEFASFFAGEELKDLSIITDCSATLSSSSFAANSLNAFEIFLRMVAPRIPDLQTFKLSYVQASASMCRAAELEGTSTIAPAVSLFLCSLRNLRSIEICPKLISPTILAELPDLERLNLRCDQHHSGHPLTQTKPGKMKSRKASNQSAITTLVHLEKLSTLTFDSDYATAISLLTSFAPVNLKELDIESQIIESNNIYHLFAAIGRNCPKLNSLRLKSMDSVIHPTFHAATEVLQNLHEMQFFYLDQDMRIPDYEFKDLLRAWPQLEELHLVYREDRLNDIANFTPDLLPFIALHCPLLRKLTLKIDWNEIFEPEFNVECSFSSLEYFDVGPLIATLPKSKIAMIALFLTSLSVPRAVVLEKANIYGDDLWKEVEKSMELSLHYVRRARDWMQRVKQLEDEKEKWSKHTETCPHLHPHPPTSESDDHAPYTPFIDS